MYACMFVCAKKGDQTIFSWQQFLYICMCVCMYVNMYVMYTCMCVRLREIRQAAIPELFVYVYLLVCVHVCMAFECLFSCMHMSVFICR
jgi:hypothetical protein